VRFFAYNTSEGRTGRFFEKVQRTQAVSPSVRREVFGERVIATAILDWLLHHSTIVSFKRGVSYQIRERSKAGPLAKRARPERGERLTSSPGL